MEWNSFFSPRVCKAKSIPEKNIFNTKLFFRRIIADNEKKKELNPSKLEGLFSDMTG